MVSERSFRKGDVEFSISKCTLYNFNFKCPICNTHSENVDGAVFSKQGFSLYYRDYSDDSILINNSNVKTVCIPCGRKCLYSTKKFEQIVCILKMKGVFE